MIWEELAAAAVVGGVVGWLARSLVGRRGGPDRVAAGGPATPPPAHRTAPSAVLVAPTPPVPAPAPTGGSMSGRDPGPRLSEGADTAGRVIAHLGSLGRLGNDEIARVGFTQQGIGAALGLRQGTVAKVLQRLEAADVVEVDRRHVSGEPRRLKIYRLTALGESVARDLRHRRPPTPPGSPGTTS